MGTVTEVKIHCAFSALFHMLAYSGKVIPNHFYWGDLIINLGGMSFPKSKYPILENHDQDREIGFATREITSESWDFKKA